MITIKSVITVENNGANHRTVTNRQRALEMTSRDLLWGNKRWKRFGKKL